MAEKFGNLTTEFSENFVKIWPKTQFSGPHISPKWGPIAPVPKMFFLGPQGL